MAKQIKLFKTDKEKLQEAYNHFYNELLMLQDDIEQYCKQYCNRNKELKQNDYYKYYLEAIHLCELQIQSLRIPTLNDTMERDNQEIFVSEVREVIPDDEPLLFHGNGIIGAVEEIIKSGGLFTQKDRGMNVSWSSSAICACPKNNIEQAAEIANYGKKYCMPYGALFVIAPKDEIEKSSFSISKNNKESISVTNSIDFHAEPNRLVAIITTNENLDRLKMVARENGLDENKVMNHKEFIDMCKKKYSENSIKNSL